MSIQDAALSLQRPLLRRWTFWWLLQRQQPRRSLFRFHLAGLMYVCLQLLPTAQGVVFKMYCKHTHHLRLYAALVSLSYKVITVSDNNCEIYRGLTYLESMGICEMLLLMVLCYLHRNIRLK